MDRRLIGGVALAGEVEATRGFHLLRHDVAANPNVEMILNSAEVPPFLRAVKAVQAERSGVEVETFTWQQWLGSANDDHLINFSQWYSERLNVIENPESKSAFVAEMKRGYEARIDKAIDDGWIDERHRETLRQRIDLVDIRFFSPFGHIPEDVGALHQRNRSPELLLLPITTGDQMVVHELGHVFAGIGGASMRRYFEHELGGNAIRYQTLAMGDLYNVLNEGFNEHMTVALLSGHPELVSPSGRARSGMAELPGSSELYRGYREVFAALLGGVSGAIERDDVKAVVNTMAAGDFAAFANLVDSQWPGRRVLVEMLDAVQTHRNATRFEEPTVDDNDRVLVQKLVARLRAVRQLPPAVGARA